MVKIEIEFPSVEHALVALGKIAGLTGKAEVKEDTPAKIASREATQNAYKPAQLLIAEIEAEKTTRKGRSDKGRSRKPKEGAGGSASSASATSTDGNVVGTTPPAENLASTQTAPAPSPDTPAPDALVALAASTATVAPVAGVPTLEACQELIKGVHDKFGLSSAMSFLGEHGVSRVRDLPEDKRAEFVTAANKKLA